MPAIDVVEIGTLHNDFSRGLVSGLSEVGLGSGRRRAGLNWVRRCDNAVFRPRRGVSVRSGSTDTSTSALPQKPTSLGKYYVTGANKLFAATDNGAGGGSIYLHTPTAETVQTLPFTPTDKNWRFEMFNGVLIACQSGGSQKPIFFEAANPANTWHSMVLPAPTTAPTFGADQPGGALTVTKDYFYRVRWRHKNGNSVTSPVSAAKQVVAASGNYTIRVNIPLPGAARSDYLGWTLERSKSTGSVLGPFYTVADGTASTYDDGKADSALFTRTSEVIHGEPPHLEGVIGHKGRLFGWVESLLYVSQPITGPEATGIFNWQADLFYPVQKDDGDSIQTVLIQSDRLVILKANSIHVLEGDDIDNFQLRSIYQGLGCCGPRAAATTGQIVWFASGNGRFNLLDGDRVLPIADDELREYLADMDFTKDSSIIAKNLIGDFVLFFYTSVPSSYNEDIVAFDLRQRVWTHITGWRCADALVQKDAADFNRATLLLADPKTISGYHIWSAFSGTKDQRTSAGTGGNAIPFSMDSPVIDDGYPDQDKDYEWLEAYVEKGQAQLAATLLLENGAVATVPLVSTSAGPKYDSGAKYDSGIKYAVQGKTTFGSGLPKGTIGRRYSVRINANTTEELVLGGYSTRGFMLPTQRYS